MNTQYTLNKGVVLAFSKGLFEPKSYRIPGTNKQSEPRYSAMFVFPPDHPDWEAIRKHIFRVAREEWPSIKWAEFSKPLKDGTELADKRSEQNASNGKKLPDMDFARGMHIMQASSSRPPALSYMEKGMIVDCLEDVAKSRAQAKFFFGAEVVAQFNFRAWNTRDGKMVAAYVNLVMATGKGKRIGGPAPGSKVFASMQGRESDEDPTDDGPTDDEEL